MNKSNDEFNVNELIDNVLSEVKGQVVSFDYTKVYNHESVKPPISMELYMNHRKLEDPIAMTVHGPIEYYSNNDFDHNFNIEDETTVEEVLNKLKNEYRDLNDAYHDYSIMLINISFNKINRDGIAIKLEEFEGLIGKYYGVDKYEYGDDCFDRAVDITYIESLDEAFKYKIESKGKVILEYILKG